MDQAQPNLNALYTANLYCILQDDKKNKNGMDYKVEFEKNRIVFSYRSSWFKQAVAGQFGLLGMLIKKLVDKKWGKETKIEASTHNITKIELYRNKIMGRQIQTLRFWNIAPSDTDYKNIYLTINVKDEELAQVRNVMQNVFSKAQYAEVNG